jgi:hypothetical protein
MRLAVRLAVRLAPPALLLASPASAEKVSVACCDLWHATTQFVHVSTGERLVCPESSCKTDPVVSKIVKNMVPALTDDGGPTWFSFDHADMFASERVADVLAYSILGRVCADDRSLSGDGRDFLQFNTDSHTIRVRRKGCEYEKFMYSFLLTLCVIVLSFVVVVGIITRPRAPDHGKQEAEPDGQAGTRQAVCVDDSVVQFRSGSGIKYRPVSLL